MHLTTFLEIHPQRKSRRAAANPDELRQLTSSDGVLRLKPPPAETTHFAVPSQSGDPGCHLWVFDESGIPYILEIQPVTPPLQTGKVKHSNLTGGGLAASGGELWVDPADQSHLFVTGCSGRYGPESEQALLDSEAVFRARGFRVTSFGWDTDAGRPAMVLR